jgi:hypothetical protein
MNEDPRADLEAEFVEGADAESGMMTPSMRILRFFGKAVGLGATGSRSFGFSLLRCGFFAVRVSRRGGLSEQEFI